MSSNFATETSQNKHYACQQQQQQQNTGNQIMPKILHRYSDILLISSLLSLQIFPYHRCTLCSIKVIQVHSYNIMLASRLAVRTIPRTVRRALVLSGESSSSSSPCCSMFPPSLHLRGDVAYFSSNSRRGGKYRCPKCGT